jgi:cytochrome c-type biogenesis protein
VFDISMGGAALAGLISFLSPCILPIVPFYLSYLAGVSMGQITEEGKLTTAVRVRAFVAALFFSAGVLTIFVALGAGASSLGQVVREWFDILRWIAAALIIAMGLHFLGVVRIPILYRQLKADAGNTDNLGFLGAYVIGLAFAFGWTPCVGPVLAAILFTAAGQESAGEGARLLMAYGIGMTAPFVLAALFIGPFMRFMSRFRKHMDKVEKVMGALLILFGVLIATNSVNLIAQWMIETFPVFTTMG